MKTPRNGTRIVKTSHPVLPTPERSWRLKMSPQILNSSMNHMTQTKKTSIDQNTSRNV